MFRITFLVDDKHLADSLRGLAGVAHDLQVVPVVNAVVTKKGEVHARTNGKFSDQLVELMREKKLTSITGKEARVLVKGIGGNPASYSHFLNEAVRDGKLRKVGKGTQRMRYELVLLREAK